MYVSLYVLLHTESEKISLYLEEYKNHRNIYVLYLYSALFYKKTNADYLFAETSRYL